MSRFKKSNSKEIGAISTASLPDIIFMLLFFFMVTTVMKENTVNVKISAPKADQIKKLENKSLVSYIYIGQPRNTATYGTLPRIQLNDIFASTEEIRQFVAGEREKLEEGDRPKMTVSLKVDKETEMGIVTDVKQELRKASALKINYSTLKGKATDM
ncbi:MAG: biopolymer transporter ExbD [Bacteroidales bacterium]|nr:biopolymer transporter ExbD [Bacteroidales bacterium]